MRTFVLFALTLAATAVVADAADAGIFRRGGRRGASSSACCGSTGYGYGSGGYGAAYASSSGSCCGGGVTTAGYYSGSGAMMYPSGTTVGGQETVITGTDGQTYTLGADGRYYLGSSGVTTMGGFTSQPYSSGYYGTYPAYSGSRGYSSYYPGGVYPAGTTAPLAMPGAPVPGVMPPRR